MKEIYLDNAATTQVSEEAEETFISSLKDYYANPSSLHNKGFEAEKKIDEVKEGIAKKIGALKDEIYFTSGGTLSNNIAVLGTYEARKRTHNRYITTKLEHPSVLEAFKALEEKGQEVIYLASDEKGYVSFEELKAHLNENTALVSIIHTNNEIGTVNHINDLGKFIKENSTAYFHSDGVQGFGKLPFDVFNVDMLSFSSHKIHGVKGIGGLYIHNKVKIKPIIFGGGQQKGIFPGTENVSGILSFSRACETAFENSDANYKYVHALKIRMVEIAKELEDVIINGDELHGSPYILNLSFLDIRGEVLLHALAKDGVYISTGSACSSKGSSKNIIQSLGKPKDIAEGAVRISFSKYNTLEEIDCAKELMIKHVKMLRKYIRRK